MQYSLITLYIFAHCMSVAVAVILTRPNDCCRELVTPYLQLRHSRHDCEVWKICQELEGCFDASSALCTSFSATKIPLLLLQVSMHSKIEEQLPNRMFGSIYTVYGGKGSIPTVWAAPVACGHGARMELQSDVDKSSSELMQPSGRRSLTACEHAISLLSLMAAF